jgi:hypothetical protein
LLRMLNLRGDVEARLQYDMRERFPIIVDR